MKPSESMEQLIKENYHHLSKGCKKVASYILDNYANAALLSSTELADNVGVSDTTVIRFSKALGFNGYAEFKKQLRVKVYESNMYDALLDMNLNLNDQYAANYMRGCLIGNEYWICVNDRVCRKPFPAFEEIPPVNHTINMDWYFAEHPEQW